MRTHKFIFPILLFLVLFTAGAFLMLYLQTSLRPTTMILGVDLYPRWVGTQVVLQGESPYSQETQEAIWLAIYGSREVPNANLFGFYYPPAITTLFMPFVLLGISTDLAAALWCAFLWALYSTILLFWVMDFRDLKRGLLILPALLISGWFFRPAFSNYLLGQFALFCVLAAIASWLSFKNNRPGWAGIFAALSLIKPSLTIIPIGFLYVEHWRKPKGILAFIASSLILYLPPTVLIGWWLPDFLTDISNYAIDNRVGWSSIDIWMAPGLFWLLISIALIGIGIYAKDNRLTFSSAFALNAIFIPHTADYDLVAFIPLLIYLGDQWLKKRDKRSLYTILFLTLVWIPWLSLVAIILLNNDRSAVETWYRFIWLAYPSLILLSGMLTQAPTLQAITHRVSGE